MKIFLLVVLLLEVITRVFGMEGDSFLKDLLSPQIVECAGNEPFFSLSPEKSSNSEEDFQNFIESLKEKEKASNSSLGGPSAASSSGEASSHPFIPKEHSGTTEVSPPRDFELNIEKMLRSLCKRKDIVRKFSHTDLSKAYYASLAKSLKKRRFSATERAAPVAAWFPRSATNLTDPTQSFTPMYRTLSTRSS